MTRYTNATTDTENTSANATSYTLFGFRVHVVDYMPPPPPVVVAKPNLNPFEVLELGSAPVSMEMVTKQYRKLAKLHHPDMPGGSLERMSLINGAYEFIRDYYHVGN